MDMNSGFPSHSGLIPKRNVDKALTLLDNEDIFNLQVPENEPDENGWVEINGYVNINELAKLLKEDEDNG